LKTDPAKVLANGAFTHRAKYFWECDFFIAASMTISDMRGGWVFSMGQNVDPGQFWSRSENSK